MTYLIVFFSDPGKLFEDFKSGLTEDQIKSIEEVNIFRKKTLIYKKNIKKFKH